LIEPPEAERNSRLRRVDWRFLLGLPRPRKAFCRAGGELTDAVATIAGEIVTEAPGGGCDLAVAEDPGPPVLDELYAALRPGGACYLEWRPRPGGAERMVRALRAAGFTDITCYRRRYGSGGLPIYWVPLGARGARAYVRSRLRLPGGRVRRLRAEVRRRLRDIARGRWASISAVAYRPGGAPEGERGPSIWLRSDWPRGKLGPFPARLSTLLATGGPRSVNKVVLLAFAEPSPVPCIAVKAPRIDRAAAGLRREATVLESLGARHTPGGIPRLLFRRECDGVPVIGESAISGRPLDRLLDRGNFRAWASRVTDWLIALGAESPVRSAARWREEVVEPALSRFVDQFGSVADPDLLRGGERIVRAIGALSVVPEQRDFGPWNLLVTPSGELAVLDWESGLADGLPALDLLYYLAYASFSVDRAYDRDGRVASYRRSLDASSPTGAVRRECLARYAGALGLEARQLEPLRVLLWLLHAPSDFQHAAADAGGPPEESTLAKSLFLALWAEEVRHVSAG
jgi:hypothetical protein